MRQVYLGLGSNMGNRKQYLEQAIDALDSTQEILVTNRARLYETAPYGEVPQPDFLNSVIEIETTLTPEALLQRIHAIELQLGRVRAIHWGPRTIDIDILLMEGLHYQSPELVIPHQELTKRSFVLIPLQDVYKEALLLGKTLPQWIEESGNAHEVRESKEIW